MSTITMPPSVVLDPQPRRITRDEYYRMAEMGFFRGQRTELLEGEIVVLSPQGPPHYVGVMRVARLTEHVFGTRYANGFEVRMQGPIALGPHSESEPDVAVVRGRPGDGAVAHPQTAALMIDVSDSTLASDRGRKGSLFARAGIADYWIVNIPDVQLEVYRNPVPDAAQPYGFRYADRTILRGNDTVSPLALPHVTIAVADLLG